MNKQQLSPLEQYRDEQAMKRHFSVYMPWREGFDTAIALDLPVKFAEWASGEGYMFVKGLNANWWYHDYRSNELSSVLYKHWLDNIYKAE